MAKFLLLKHVNIDPNLNEILISLHNANTLLREKFDEKKQNKHWRKLELTDYYKEEKIHQIIYPLKWQKMKSLIDKWNCSEVIEKKIKKIKHLLILLQN